MLTIKESLIKCLRGRIAALRGTCNLAYLVDMSRVLRAVRLALHPARQFNQRCPKQPTNNIRRKQAGVILMITLIVLVAMTLAAIGLIRSVDTTNLIAGNLAFRQATTHASDAGMDDALNVLIPQLVANNQLMITNCPAGFGYKSFHDPMLEPPNQTWDQFWAAVNTCAKTLPRDGNGNSLNAAGQIVAYGSTVQYVLESMCNLNGQAGTCATPPPSAAVSCSGSDLGQSTQKCVTVNQRYYRITTRVQGPRNTVSYYQAMLAM